MEKNFNFYSEEETKKIIFSTLDEVEKWARARLLPREKIYLVIEEITKTPFGYAEGDGGNVARSYKYMAETTHFFCSWYTWRFSKHIHLNVSRGPSKKVPHGTNPYISIRKNKEMAYRTVLTDRWARLNQIKKRRLIRHLPQPPSDSISFARKDEGGLVVATFDKLWYVWVGTPAGWIKTKSTDRKRNAWLHLKDLGFPVPTKKDKRVWDGKMQAHAIISVI